MVYSYVSSFSFPENMQIHDSAISEFAIFSGFDKTSVTLCSQFVNIYFDHLYIITDFCINSEF